MARTHKRNFVKRDQAQTRAYSPAVITEGGRIVWLAGQTAGEDATGRSLAGDFEGQVREISPASARRSRRRAARSTTW